MTDIRIVQNTNFPEAQAVTLDWLLKPSGILDDSQALSTAVIVALGTDRLAQLDDVLPDPDSDDRGGWWGDLDAEEIWNGWPIGTRLWLMKRDKITGASARQGSTLARAENFIREALQPFVDKRIASRVEVSVERGGLNRIDAMVRLYRGPKIAIELRFENLWNDQLEIV